MCVCVCLRVCVFECVVALQLVVPAARLEVVQEAHERVDGRKEQGQRDLGEELRKRGAWQSEDRAAGGRVHGLELPRFTMMAKSTPMVTTVVSMPLSAHGQKKAWRGCVRRGSSVGSRWFELRRVY